MVAVAEAKGKKDPIVMKVVDKEIPLSEFIYMAKKDNSVDLTDEKSVQNYVELFKNYKLKVADAEAMTINRAPKFESELERYKLELQESFLSDKSGEDSAVHVIYERMKRLPRFKQILFRFTKGQLVSSDTMPVYNRAMEAYNRIRNGESIEAVAESLTSDSNDSTVYADNEYVFPLRMAKALEDKIYSMEPGELSLPVRSMGGFHVIQLEAFIPNPGKVRVAHILTRFPSDQPTDEEIEAIRSKSDSLYQKVIAGEDFAMMAKTFSDDSISRQEGGALHAFGINEMLVPFEKAAFALENNGDVSKPVQTRFGFHIIKLLDRQEELLFEEVESRIYQSMRVTERNFDLYRVFDDKMKERHAYHIYTDAYAQLDSLADIYFPIDERFITCVRAIEEPLFRLDSVDVPTSLFIEYMFKARTSAKTYSKDFMNEILDLYVRDIVKEMERDCLERDYPEYNRLIGEYYDGILLFEVSNRRVWAHPIEEQPELEVEWMKELNEKYPVTIHWKVIKKLKKYLNT
jgi:peptidyl-prolyl cis-trans isomerase SurA